MEKIRILQVEDEKYNMELIRLYLQDNFVVDSALTVEEALKFVGGFIYPVILMDIKLDNGRNGTELMKEIRKLPGYESCIMIAITAYAGKEEKERFLDAGFDYYLSKPFSRDRLSGFLKKILETELSHTHYN